MALAVAAAGTLHHAEITGEHQPAADVAALHGRRPTPSAVKTAWRAGSRCCRSRESASQVAGDHVGTGGRSRRRRRRPPAQLLQLHAPPAPGATQHS